MKLKIIFEDETFLVVEKPPNLVVNRAETVKGETLQDWLEEYLKVPREEKVPRVPRARDTRGTRDSRDAFLNRSGVVHRLDKETSGLLLVAKTERAFKNLQKQFKERQVVKRYLALVHRKVTPEKGRVEVPLSRDRKKFGVFLGGRPAKTKYKVISNWLLVIGNKKEEFSLLELTPETGRTHQIRVHLKFINHPVVADATYAGRKTARRDRRWCPRQFLHASYLAFTHPETGKKVEFTSPLPADLRAALTRL